MDHRSRVHALCAALRIDFHPEHGIPEQSLGITELVFHTAKGEEKSVPAAFSNRAARLFLEELTRKRKNRKEVIIDEEFLQLCQEYFAEAWPPAPDRDQPLFFYLATSVGIDVKWKPDYWTHKPLL